jgi:arylsulfatase
MLWKEKYPDSPEKHGIPWTGFDNPGAGIENLHRPKMNLKDIPFDPLEYVEHLDQLPFDPDMDPDIGQ